jgi:hypothetical protein
MVDRPKGVVERKLRERATYIVVKLGEEATLNPICVRPPIRLSRVPPCDRRPIALVKSLSFPRQAKAQAGETHFRGRYQLSNFKWTFIAGARQAPSLTALPHAFVCSGGFLVSRGGVSRCGESVAGSGGMPR